MDGPVLLERDEELGVLHELAAEMAASGRGAVALVSGEAGIGKTALLRQFRDELPRRVTRLWGTCDPLFTPRPLGPLIEPTAEVGGEPAELLAAGAKPFDVAVALADALGPIAPVLLIVDDVHWADEATLDVLRVLARRTRDLGLLLVISHRSDQLHRDHPLRMVLGELSSHDGVTRLEVLPLLAQGLRNSEIANRLVVSPKTVDHHVSSILRKLGATNRSQACATATRLGVFANETDV